MSASSPDPAALLPAPAELHSADRSHRRIVLASIFGGSLLYTLTCAPGVLWQDSGMFQYRVRSGDLTGIQGLPLAHPLYILLAGLFAKLPLGDHAFRVNLFSSLCGAIALGLTADLVLCLTRSRTAAICGVVLLGVSHTFWTHAVIAEVYELYAVGLLAELCLVARFVRRRTARWLLLAAFVNGLNLSNHLLAILHWPAYLGLILWATRHRRLAGRHAAWLVTAAFAGSVPYLYLIGQQIAAGQAPVTTLKQALVGPPQRADVVLTHSFPLVRQAKLAALYFALNFPTPLLALAPLGLLAALRLRRLHWFGWMAGVTFVVGFLFAFRYLVPDQFVFYMPCYVLLPLFVAIGVAQFAPAWDWRGYACLACAVFPALVYELAPALLRSRSISIGLTREIPYRDGYDYFIRPRKNGYDGAARFAREALESASPAGLLLADSTITNALAYVRDFDLVHPGVALSTFCDVRPAPPSVDMTPDQVRPFLERGTVLACTIPSYLPPWLGERCDFLPSGILYRLVPKSPP